MFVFFFFFNDTATTEIYTLSLHDALPISIDETYVTHGTYASEQTVACPMAINRSPFTFHSRRAIAATDRKSTRLNSSHANISYAVFCLKKKKNTDRPKKNCHKA